MGTKRCRVSFVDLLGVTRATEVDASSLNEAVILAIVEMRGDEFATDQFGHLEMTVSTEFTVSVIPRPVEHRIKFVDVKTWLNKKSVDAPFVMAKRAKLIELFQCKPNPSARRSHGSTR